MLASVLPRSHDGWGCDVSPSCFRWAMGNWEAALRLAWRQSSSSARQGAGPESCLQAARDLKDGWVSIVAVLNPDSGEVSYFEAVALPFGAVSAVTGFNRAARALRRILSILFSWSSNLYRSLPGRLPKRSSDH